MKKSIFVIALLLAACTISAGFAQVQGVSAQYSLYLVQKGERVTDSRYFKKKIDFNERKSWSVGYSYHVTGRVKVFNGTNRLQSRTVYCRFLDKRDRVLDTVTQRVNLRPFQRRQVIFVSGLKAGPRTKTGSLRRPRDDRRFMTVYLNGRKKTVHCQVIIR